MNDCRTKCFSRNSRCNLFPVSLLFRVCMCVCARVCACVFFYCTTVGEDSPPRPGWTFIERSSETAFAAISSGSLLYSPMYLLQRIPGKSFTRFPQLGFSAGLTFLGVFLQIFLLTPRTMGNRCTWGKSHRDRFTRSLALLSRGFSDPSQAQTLSFRFRIFSLPLECSRNSFSRGDSRRMKGADKTTKTMTCRALTERGAIRSASVSPGRRLPRRRLTSNLHIYIYRFERDDNDRARTKKPGPESLGPRRDATRRTSAPERLCDGRPSCRESVCRVLWSNVALQRRRRRRWQRHTR